MEGEEYSDFSYESDEDHNPVIVKRPRKESFSPKEDAEECQGSNEDSLEPGSHIGEEKIIEEEGEVHPPTLKSTEDEKKNETAPEIDPGTVMGGFEREEGFDKVVLEVKKYGNDYEDSSSECEDDDERGDTSSGDVLEDPDGRVSKSSSSSIEGSLISSKICKSESGSPISEGEIEEEEEYHPINLGVKKENEGAEESEEEIDIGPIKTEGVTPGNGVESSESEEDDGEVSGTLCGGGEDNSGNNEEVILSGDDEEEEAEVVTEVNTSIYNTRKHQKVDYMEVDSDEDIQQEEEDKALKKNILDVFDLKDKTIRKLIENPDRLDHITRLKIFYMDGTRDEKISLASQLIKKIGDQIETMYVCTKCDQKSFFFLSKALKHSKRLAELSFKYSNEKAASQLLEVLGKLRSRNHLQNLSSLKLTSLNSGREVSLKEEQMKKLSELDIQFENLELGDSLWEDVKPETIERLLQRNGSLKKLVIHGGFRGKENKEKKVIAIPEMKNLTNLSICPVYTFVSKEPVQLKSGPQVVNLEEEEGRVKFFKIGITFTGETPALKRLELGGLIEIEDLQFSTLRKLKKFKCGSNWNIGLKFPEGVRQTLMESKITELQFPDGLKDPSFPVEIAKNFPKLKKVWIYLPSVPVLRAFFKAFEASKVEELFLQTQFDFKSTLESCLMPNLEDVTKMDKKQELLLDILKKYKHFEEYVRYYNIQLPVTEEDLMEGHSAGIRALKNLKVLELEHIPRTLSIPQAGEERKWFDQGCKFRKKEKIGFEMYPLSVQCCKELLALDLQSFVWRKNIKICENMFNKAGYQPYSYSMEEEDIFTRIKVGSCAGAKVTIRPSMLVPNVKVKLEREEE